MMILESPTVLRLPADLSVTELKRALTFKNRAALFELQRFRKNRWFSQQFGEEAYQEKVDALKAAVEVCLLKEDEKGYWTYPGLKAYLQTRFKLEFRNDVVYPEPKLLAYDKKPEHPPRYYQTEAVDRLLESKHAAIEFATGAGKSLIAEMICKRLGLKTLIMAPSKSIAGQLHKQLTHRFGAKRVGLFGDGRKKSDKLITVGIAASLTKVAPGSEAWEDFSKTKVLIADECFPYEAAVITEGGVRTIGSLVNSIINKKEVPRVLSFNLSSRLFEYKKITNCSKTAMRDDLVTVNFSRSSVTCTSNHPLLTRQGWKQAATLTSGDIVLGYCPQSSKNRAGGRVFNSDQTQLLLGGYLGDASFEHNKYKYRAKFIHGDRQRSYLEWKARMLSRSNYVKHQDKNGFSQTPAHVFLSDSFLSPYKFDCPKKEVDPRLVGDIDWRGIAVWYMDDGSLRSIKYKGEVRYHHAFFHTESFSESTVDALIQKLCSLGVTAAKYTQASRRDKGIKYHIIRTSTSGAKELFKNIAQYLPPELEYKMPPEFRGGKKYAWDNTATNEAEYLVSSVDKLEHIEYPPRHDYRNWLYDLEIEDNHNFVVSGSRRGSSDGRGGVIVHNCHLTPAETQEKVCSSLVAKAPYRFFVSGTQMRADGAGMLLDGITGPVVMRLSVKELVDQGFLAKPNFFMHRVESTSTYNHPDHMKMMNAHFWKNPTLAAYAAELANKSVELLKHQVLILVEHVDQFQYLLPLLRYEVGFAHGGLSATNKGSVDPRFHKSDPDELVERFNAGELPILIGTSCVSTGTDFTSVNTILNLQGGKSEVKVRQSIGRGTRRTPSKTHFNYHDFFVALPDSCHDERGLSSVERHALDRRNIFDSVYGPTKWINGSPPKGKGQSNEDDE